MNIAIVGATGNVGRKIIEVLENKNFPISELFLIASSKSEGKKINFKDKELTVIDLEKFDFSKVKIAFFAAGSAIAEKWAYKVAEKTIVIDNSKFFRKDPDIPLIVPEVNSKELINVKNKNIIANANCSVIPLVVALKPLHDLYNIKRIIASTYQSVSGAGKAPSQSQVGPSGRRGPHVRSRLQVISRAGLSERGYTPHRTAIGATFASADASNRLDGFNEAR